MTQAATPGAEPVTQLSTRSAVFVFAAFALAYFLSNVVRAITATLSPELTREFELDAGDLGLLAAGYFLGFALTQIPLGRWLDRHGPRKVELAFLSVAVMGCLMFAVAQSFAMLVIARVLIGVGVSACLMAPLTGYRRWLAPAHQIRSNSWMLMVGSSGVVASTLPVQWLLPLMGWRGLFVLLAVGVVLSIGALAWAVPAWRVATKDVSGVPEAMAGATAAPTAGYRQVWESPFFRSVAPLGFFINGGLAAMQALWIVPWLIRVHGHTPAKAAQGLFVIALALLLSYWLWGLINPRLVRSGWSAQRLLGWLVPLNLVALAAIVLLGQRAGVGPWLVYCVTATTVSLAQPATALAVPAEIAGRALSAFNLVVFAGVFVLQWGVGLLIDFGLYLGHGQERAFQLSLGVFWVCCSLAYGFFMWARPYDRDSSVTAP